jgi:hypothetical protein
MGFFVPIEIRPDIDDRAGRKPARNRLRCDSYHSFFEAIVVQRRWSTSASAPWSNDMMIGIGQGNFKQVGKGPLIFQRGGRPHSI